MKQLLVAMTFLFGLALSTAAGPFPQLFDVAGVSASDVLNIRENPSAKSTIIGQLMPRQRDVEVIASDPSGKWGLVNAGEGSGWVAMRFMRPSAGDADYAMGVRSLRCSGTEPFWTLDIIQGQSARLSSLTEATQTFPAGTLISGAGRPDRFLLGLGTGSVAVISQEMCNDGMSDKSFALRVDFITNAGDQKTLLSGCCTLVP